MSTDCVIYEESDGVAHVTLNRPEAFNALDLATISRLNEIVETATNDRIRAVLLTGAGPAFCAGGDIKTMLTATGDAGRGAAASEAMLVGVGELHRALHGFSRLPKPVIAAVNGAAAGGGVGLMLAADVAWAASSAVFTLAFTGIGVSPDSGTTFHLPRAVGPKLAAELFFTNRQLAADEALAVGLVSRVLGDDELLPQCRKLAGRLARGPSLAYARVKALLRSSNACDLETQLGNEARELGNSAATADFAEGLEAFVQKRRPVFRGE